MSKDGYFDFARPSERTIVAFGGVVVAFAASAAFVASAVAFVASHAAFVVVGRRKGYSAQWKSLLEKSL